jgi:cystathionine beta-synthase
MGTCGTITGTARYLKERNPDVKVVGVDPEGSIFSDPDDVHSYAVEGVGEDFYPATTTGRSWTRSYRWTTASRSL